MTVTEVRSPERPTAIDAALVASLKRPRYEIFPLDGVEDEVARHIPAEVKLTITASPSKGMEPTLKEIAVFDPPAFTSPFGERVRRPSGCCCR